jgi:hypothetical protein
MEKVTIFAIIDETEIVPKIVPIAKRTTLFNGETRFESLNTNLLITLPGNTELIALEETTDSIKTLDTLMQFLSAQTIKQKLPEVILSSTFIPAVNMQHFFREDVVSNDFDEIKGVK